MEGPIIVFGMIAYLIWNGVYGLLLPERWCESRFTTRGISIFGGDRVFFARLYGGLSLVAGLFMLGLIGERFLSKR